MKFDLQLFAEPATEEREPSLQVTRLGEGDDALDSSEDSESEDDSDEPRMSAFDESVERFKEEEGIEDDEELGEGEPGEVGRTETPQAQTPDFKEQMAALGQLAFADPEISKLLQNRLSGQKQQQAQPELPPLVDFDAVTPEYLDSLDYDEKVNLLVETNRRLQAHFLDAQNKLTQERNYGAYQSTVGELKQRYGQEFNENEVLKYARERGLANLEDAFKAMSYDKLKNEGVNMDRRNQRAKDFKTETGRRSGGSGGKEQPTAPLTASQKYVARQMGISEKEYGKQLSTIRQERNIGYGGANKPREIQHYK